MSTVIRDVGIEHIMELLPHRYPFLLIDKVIECVPDTSIVATKNVTINEPFFPGHFPGHPVMPGALIIEAMAQASGMLVQLSRESARDDGATFYLVRVDKARFSQKVVPGDTLMLKVQQKRIIRKMGLYACTAEVDDKKVASCEVLCAVSYNR